MVPWELMHSGTLTAAENMALDKELLDNLHQRSTPLIRFYDWKNPSITFGYFSNPSHWLDLETLKEGHIDLAKRPTGGGITLHMGDLAFSAFLPACNPNFSCCTLDNYAYINNAVAKAILDCFIVEKPQLLATAEDPEDKAWSNFCMAHPTQYDVIISGKKVGGAAQRRTKNGFLHHGTICLEVPDEQLLSRLFLRDSGTSLIRAITRSSFPLAAGMSAEELDDVRERLQKALYMHLCNS